MSIDGNTPCPTCGCQCMTLEECHKQQSAQQPVGLTQSEDEILYAIKDAIEDVGDDGHGVVRSGYCFSANEAAAAAMQVIRPILRSPKRESSKEAYTLVPSAALAWLFGEEGEFLPDVESRGGKYWWRGTFRRMIKRIEDEKSDA